MGCYGSELIVEKTPAVLQKLCAQVRVTTPIDNPFEKLTLRAHFNGETIAEMDVDFSQFPKPEGKTDAKWLMMMAIMTFSPFVISESGKLEIEAETEDETLSAPSLSIRRQAEGEQISWGF